MIKHMATEREIELQQELNIRNEQFKRVQNQFRDVSLQYFRASITCKYASYVSWFQTLIIVWLATKIIFQY